VADLAFWRASLDTTASFRSPSGVTRVKKLQPDVSGIEEALQPMHRLLAGPREHDLGHMLANWGQGTSGQAFTIDPSSIRVQRPYRPSPL
jgi:hypothetical protein